MARRSSADGGATLDARPRMEERHQRLAVDVFGEAAMLNADPERLQQVFLNVLANASTRRVLIDARVHLRSDAA